MSLSPRSARRSSHATLGTDPAQRARESLSGAGGVLRSRGREAKEQMGLLLEQAEQRAVPAAESALAALKPRVDAAGETLQQAVLPEVKERWSVAATHLVDAARSAGEAVSPLLEDLAERAGPQAQEARRAHSAAHALRGEPKPSHRKSKAAGLLAVGAALGFLGGLLARRDATAPASSPVPVNPLAPVNVVTPPAAASGVHEASQGSDVSSSMGGQDR